MMRWRDFWTISFCLLSLVFTILTIIPGGHKGVLPAVTIATYRYDGNYTLIYPPGDPWNNPNITAGNPFFAPDSPYEAEFHEWFFSVHYLAICAGFEGGTETEVFVHLNCSQRQGSFVFRTDDKYIMDYQTFNNSFPVESRAFDSFDLRPPFATLVIGLVFAVLSLGALIYEISTRRHTTSLNLVPTSRISTLGAFMIGAAATFLLISSSIITAIILRSHYDKDEYFGWTQNFLGLTWSAVGMMYFAFLIKLSDMVIQKEKKRRLLRTGQI